MTNQPAFYSSCLRRLGIVPLLGALTGLLGLSACETDFDSNDLYHETTVIYAVLDPADSVQTIRINKAFLNGTTNALDIARNSPDSTTFGVDAIDAELQWLKSDSSLLVSYPLRRTELTNKDEGVFHFPTHVVYQTPADMPALDTTKLYRIQVRNRRTGTLALATTSLPPRPLIRRAGSASINTFVTGGQDMTYPFQAEQPGGINFLTAPRATLYQGEAVFNFLEIRGADTLRRTLIWPIFSNSIVTTPVGADNPLGQYAENAFFGWLRSALNVSQDPPGLQRRVVDVYWRVWAGSPQWATYTQVLSSYSALSQTVPEYTNVRNGRGLVTGRNSRQIRTEVRTPLTRQRFTEQFPEGRFVF